MNEAEKSLKKTARLAGLLYLILSIAAIYGFMYVPSEIIVQGDTVATADNMLAHQFFIWYSRRF